MSSIQERLQLKRVPIDTWTIREQLCLASAVVRSGDQNWMSVSRALKTVGDPNRPADWYSQKSCAAQYGAMLEHTETPKRKKRNSEGAAETPQESILKRLTQERIAEIQKSVSEMTHQYQLLKNEISEIRNPSTSEERLKELWAGVEAQTRARERETAKRAAWVREREERRMRLEKNWRPSGEGANVSTVAAPPSSPLLTSLLKSSPVVTTPQLISHPANVVETVSPSAGAPTLSMLLEKSQQDRSTPQDHKHAAIEHIKSQLVQIEQQLKAGSPPCRAPVLPPAPAALDIDDIEIKAEDVYAFRDVEIELPTRAHVVPTSRPQEKASPSKKDDYPPITAEYPAHSSTEANVQSDVNMEIDTITPTETEQIVNVDIPKEQQEQPQIQPATEPEVREETEVKISFPEVKFPTLEIKVIQPEEPEIKEELKESETLQEESEIVEVGTVAPPVAEQTVTIQEQATTKEEQNQPAEHFPNVPELAPETAERSSESEREDVVVDTDCGDIPLPEGLPTSAPICMSNEEPEATPEPEEIAPPKEEEKIQVVEMEEEVVDEGGDVKMEVEEEPAATDAPASHEAIQIEALTSHLVEVKDDKPETEDKLPDTETDDDTPMELSREEEKDGKKRRDYSRKKKPESRTCSGSESAAESSAPESPAQSDAERQRRLWRKSVMLLYSRLCAHKCASLFLRPITDDQAPGYSVAVKRPMDLATIKKNIDSGACRSTAEFHRDVLLMLSNALMYNSSEHRVYQMAKEMFNEASVELRVLLAAQAHAGLSAAPPRRSRHRH